MAIRCISQCLLPINCKKYLNLSYSIMASAIGISFIEVNKKQNPIELVNEWRLEAEKNGATANLMSLATSTKDGKVSNRNVVLREMTGDCFVFATNRGSRKAQIIKENPLVAATFVWVYKIGEKSISRQARIEGTAAELSHDISERLYNESPMIHKIRAHVNSNMGAEVEWEELNAKLKEFIKNVEENKVELRVPETDVAYKIVPQSIELYHSSGPNMIADRILFTKQNDGEWIHTHLVA